MKFIDYKAKFNGAPDQFAAQSYDAMYIVAQALKNTKISGDLPKDRTALRDALPSVQWTGATGALQVPPGQRPRRQARRLRRRPGADRQRDQGRQVRHREVIGTRPLMGMRLARGLTGVRQALFIAGPPQDKNIPRPAAQAAREHFPSRERFKQRIRGRRPAHTRRGGPSVLSGTSNHVGTTIRQRLVAGLRLRPVRAGLHAGLRRARGSSIWRMARFSVGPTRR